LYGPFGLSALFLALVIIIKKKKKHLNYKTNNLQPKANNMAYL